MQMSSTTPSTVARSSATSQSAIARWPSSRRLTPPSQLGGIGWWNRRSVRLARHTGTQGLACPVGSLVLFLQSVGCQVANMAQDDVAHLVVVRGLVQATKVQHVSLYMPITRIAGHTSSNVPLPSSLRVYLQLNVVGI